MSSHQIYSESRQHSWAEKRLLNIMSTSLHEHVVQALQTAMKLSQAKEVSGEDKILDLAEDHIKKLLDKFCLLII